MSKKLKKVCFYMFSDQPLKIKEIALKERTEYGPLVRQWIEEKINSYNQIHQLVAKNTELLNLIVHNKKIIEDQQKIIQNQKSVIMIFESKLSGEDPNAIRYCQKCGQKFAVRKLHPVQLGAEVFVFCDNHFFDGSYKEIIRQLV